ncbi:MAG TPA: amino acid permease, partial [Flavisolibacter sp.]|nr:amino acid permease [Flavisolibacter sp.]
FFPSLGNEIFRIPFFVFLFGGIAFLNIRSVKNGVRLIELAALGKLVPLVLLVVIGAGIVSTENWQWTVTPTIANTGAASLLLFYAFMGFETPLSNGGEIKNARRTVPLGIFLGIGGVLVLYLAIQLLTQGVLGASIATHKDAPLAAVAGVLFGKTGITLIILTTAISMLGALGGEILSVPRILFAGARDGLLPKALARVHPHFFTPYMAVSVYASLGLLFAIFGAFRQLAIIASASSLLVYLGAVLATIKLRGTHPRSAEKTFRVPGGVIIPTLAACVILWLLSNLTKPELAGIAIFVFVFSVLYFVAKAVRKKPLPKMENRC